MSDVALVVSADLYEITDQKTGEELKLHQVWFIAEYREATDKEKGCKPIKMLTTPEIFHELMNHPLPALFDLDIKVRPGSKNSVAATITGFRFLSVPKIFPAVVLPKAA